jgi:hypothetical protein
VSVLIGRPRLPSGADVPADRERELNVRTAAFVRRSLLFIADSLNSNVPVGECFSVKVLLFALGAFTDSNGGPVENRVSVRLRLKNASSALEDLIGIGIGRCICSQPGKALTAWRDRRY